MRTQDVYDTNKMREKSSSFEIIIFQDTELRWFCRRKGKSGNQIWLLPHCAQSFSLWMKFGRNPHKPSVKCGSNSIKLYTETSQLWNLNQICLRQCEIGEKLAETLDVGNFRHISSSSASPQDTRNISSNYISQRVPHKVIIWTF